MGCCDWGVVCGRVALEELPPGRVDARPVLEELVVDLIDEPLVRAEAGQSSVGGFGGHYRSSRARRYGAFDTGAARCCACPTVVQAQWLSRGCDTHRRRGRPRIHRTSMSEEDGHGRYRGFDGDHHRGHPGYRACGRPRTRRTRCDGRPHRTGRIQGSRGGSVTAGAGDRCHRSGLRCHGLRQPCGAGIGTGAARRGRHPHCIGRRDERAHVEDSADDGRGVATSDEHQC